MTRNANDARLLTPGPLTTSQETKEVMLHDWGSRDSDFIEINRRIRMQLLKIASAEASHVCVPLQGSGTFVVEAALGTLIPRDGKVLILVNGAYGKRIAKILDYLNREYLVHETAEDTTPVLSRLDSTLAGDSKISHVVVVHCETTSGILNPIGEIADIVARHARSLLIDAMSAFGALPLSSKTIAFDAVAASSNKCLEGVPGVGFILMKNHVIETAKGNCHSLSLDLYDQWTAMEKNKQWRFTPPTHVLAAFNQAIAEHQKEGGIEGRHKRNKNNCKIICDGMKEIGFEQLLPDELQAPIIITFKQPSDTNFNFQKFYNALSDKDFLIYPGKLTVADTFRIGCIGNLNEQDMRDTLTAVKEVISDLKISL